MSENETTTTEAAESAAPEQAPLSPEAQELVEEIGEALKDVIDPELGVNVVDLGLLYGVNADKDVITLDMTLTSAACPLTDVIEDQAVSALDEFEREVKINWVWMPPWGPDKITDDGRDQLRMLGFNV
ncbi:MULTISPECIES: metal-sulfur cluster assembly factor [Nocardiopsis]|uniref:Metal-sulfur cluster biosynthetic enzyme n=1 Tax=Nocardiopsis aegyptia TaxID=220378 RepID=A0A7Z0JDF2_9ACTN|nr:MULTISPECIES: metal-sulfur cluster assembly factor [Nocardiopsis]KOX19075.1 metal-sulfur cluster biosynthesis protein [Nocardiopsis sp. NRRL B-16309]NYJ37410.1 metal-sulfur cluster biosynthetic enzyme [Nocardiopsis aegyptia]